MLNWLAIPPLWLPIVIFLLRVTDMTLDTLRVLIVIRGLKAMAWILGFFQSAIWVIAVTSVLGNLGNPWTLIGYAAGFASGNVVGMLIEERVAIGHGHLRVISSRLGSAISEAIRSAGYAATEIAGRGKDGAVTLVISSVRRRDIDRIQKEVARVDPEAFVAVEEIRPLHRGFWRA
ncbi:MAG TPA: DUF5698 domain-containing protein [Anaerolineales bacterium]|nr:DUF5698 domain-containing protein [Anaerolineales bacterium]